MSIRDALGAAVYEQLRQTIQKAFPSAKDIPDVLVDAFVRELKKLAIPSLEKLGLPEVEAPATTGVDTRASYPLYVASATHARVLKMDSSAPFPSEFVGHLPTVRVPLPFAIDYLNTSVATQIGTVDFARDHLAGSVELVNRLYADTLGYAAARVDLITPARRDFVRFGAIAVYLGYRNDDDTEPSFYVLEAGLATGQAAMLYLGKTMDDTIVQAGGYQPTPFASPTNVYTGKLLVTNDQPIALVVQANTPNLPFYIEVSVDYQAASQVPSIAPAALVAEAIARVAAIGKTMGVPTGFPTLVEDILAEVALVALPWIVKPGSPSTATASLASNAPEATAPTAPNLTPRLLSIADELVRGFQRVSAERGLSSSGGRLVELPIEVRNGLEAVLRDVEAGVEKDPAPRLARLLGGIDVQRPPLDFSAFPNGASIVAASVALALGSGPDGSTTGTGQRQTWSNQLANQRVQPLELFRPASLDDASDPQSIATILTQALTTGCVVKAAGSGHSYSDVATTPDFFLDTHGLSRMASKTQPISGQLSPEVLRVDLPLATGPVAWPSYDPENHRALVEMESGITIRALNPILQSWNLGLPNMGGYDGQTIIGAISTSTHGSGIGLGPFPDMVRSLVLATTGEWKGSVVGGANNGKNGVYVYRIEPADGITDPKKYADPNIGLIQDDDCFRSAICSMGCFGVIYSVVLEVMQMYWLSETRSLTTLDALMKDLAPNPQNPGHLPDVLLHTRNYEVLIHPYPMDHLFHIVDMDPTADPSTYYPYFKCLVTQRNIAPPPTTPPKDRAVMPDFLGKILNLALTKEPDLTPEAIDISLLTQLDTNWVNTYYQVYNLGLAGDFGFAAEIGFSLDDASGNYTDQHFKTAIDGIHRIAQRARQQGRQYQSSAFSLRFVNASNAHLSMMQGQRTAMIEMDMLTGTYGGKEIMYRYETAAYGWGGRPHWGLEFDFASGNNGLLEALYPELPKWKAVYDQFNALGTFDNAFTQRMGFTDPRGR